MGHQFAHGRLIVVVAHHAAGNARSTRGNRRLVDDENVLARSAAGFLQPQRQVIGGGKSVNAGADNGVFDTSRNSHEFKTFLDATRRSGDLDCRTP
jgi:hypothetical protein